MLSNKEKSLYTVKESAYELTVSTKQVYTLIKSGELKAVRIGKAIRISRTEIDRYINK
jgi:excisionase family DNA binding protein